MTTSLVSKLQRSFTFDDGDISGLEGLYWDTRAVRPGRDLISEGDRPSWVHLIVEGWAARYKILPDGSRQITAFLLPGDFCDLHTMLLAEMDHSIVALTPLRIAFVSPMMIDQLIRLHPIVAQAFRWTTLVDEAVLRAWIVNLGKRHAKERIAHLFCELADRLAAIGFDRAGMMPMPVTQEEIGDALGLTSVHVNRVLQELRREDLIVVRHQGLRLIDPEALAALAGYDETYLHAATNDPRGRMHRPPVVAPPAAAAAPAGAAMVACG